MTDELHEDPMDDVRPSRRRFVQGVVAATAFSVPMISSFDLSSLSGASAYALGANGSNGTTSSP